MSASAFYTETETQPALEAFNEKHILKSKGLDETKPSETETLYQHQNIPCSFETECTIAQNPLTLLKELVRACGFISSLKVLILSQTLQPDLFYDLDPNQFKLAGWSINISINNNVFIILIVSVVSKASQF